MRLQHWARGFNPYKVNSNLAQAWVRIYEILMEYFQSKIIHALAFALGTVIKMDDHTKNRTMCHYAKGCEDYVMVESEEQVMFTSIKYEQLPPFCNHYGIVGHSLENCRMVKGRKVEGDKSTVVKPQG